MKVLFDLGHPAHVHYFKNIIYYLKNKGHKVLILARNKDITLDLLDRYEIKYFKCGVNEKEMYKKAINMFKIDLCILKYARRFNADLFLSASSPYAAHVGKFLGKSVIGINDTEHATLNMKLFLPFADVVLTPSCYMKDLGSKQIRFNGYLELLYLHPNWFKPDPEVLDALGVAKDDKYVIVRFVSWAASHDVGQKGFSPDEKKKLIKAIESMEAVPMITSEVSLPEDLEKYRIRIPPHRIHDALYYATMYIGEGATMASEAAILGTPSIYISSLIGTMGNFIELERKYGLIFNYNNSESAMNKAIELIQKQNIKEEWKKKREKLLKDKIDVTSFMIWFVENYPESAEMMKENPEYQERFR